MDSWDIDENIVIFLSQDPWTHGILMREHGHYFVSRSMDSWDIAERTQSLFCLKIHGLMGYCRKNMVIILSQDPWTRGILLKEHGH